MSPQKARLFIAEDDCNWQKIYREIIENTDHTIVLMATNMKDAVDAVPKLNNLGVQVAIIDGNLSPEGEEGYEGKFLIHKIKELCPQIKTIGMSGMFHLGADIDLGKDHATQLTRIIDDL